jgi:hypothetical protein
MLTKLVVKEFVVEENSGQMEVGEIYSHFLDPETNKFYRPVEGLEITGEDLSDRFKEIE